MPELPEVERMRRGLARHLKDAALLSVESLRPGYPRYPSAGPCADDLRGARVRDIARRGKYLIWQLESPSRGPLFLVCHPRMTGHFLFWEVDSPLPPHVHALFDLRGRDGEAIRVIWQDVRRFGTMDCLDEAQLAAPDLSLNQLGPEADQWRADGRALRRSLRGRPRGQSIAAWLLDQRHVAGLGNIYVTEALHAAGLDPGRPASQLTSADWERLSEHVRRSARALAPRRQEDPRLRRQRGQGGHYQLEHRIYGRQGSACPDCGSRIGRRQIGGRNVNFCPRCVKRPRRALQKAGSIVHDGSMADAAGGVQVQGGMDMTQAMDRQPVLYVGGYGSRRLDEAAQAEKPLLASLSRWRIDAEASLAADVDWPGVVDSSYVIADAAGRHLFGVQESGGGGRLVIVDPEADPAGEVVSADIAAGGPCHLCQTGDWVFTANYGSGSVSCLRVASDRSSARAIAVIQHSGSSVNAQRQEGPHAHWVGIDAAGRWLWVVDLGLDQILRYPLDALLERLEALEAKDEAEAVVLDPQDLDVQPIALPAGEGPRHIAMRADGTQAYIVTELGNRVFRFDPSEDEPELIDCGTAGGVEGEHNQPAAIRLSADERWLATSVRGTDHIGLFAVGDDGALELRANVACGGVWPRDLLFSADGRWLWSANEQSHEITRLAIDSEGGLSDVSLVARVSAPAVLLEMN